MNAFIELIKKHIAKLPQGDPGRATLADLATALVLEPPSASQLEVKHINGVIYILVTNGYLTEGTITRLTTDKMRELLGNVVVLESETNP